jgi:hypothetical protein
MQATDEPEDLTEAELEANWRANDLTNTRIAHRVFLALDILDWKIVPQDPNNKEKWPLMFPTDPDPAPDWCQSATVIPLRLKT